MVLDGLKQDQVEIGAVAARIQELGGVDAAYEAMRRHDKCSSRKIGESVMPEPTKRARRSRPQRTLEDVEAAHEAVHGIPKMVGGDDAFGFVQRVAGEYAVKNEGHIHKSVTHFLQRAYLAALRIKNEPHQFERLKADPFWEDWWRKPNDASTSKWVLYFIMGAKTAEVRIRATKFAVILDNYLQWNWRPEEIIGSIEYEGGVETAYEAVQARKREHANWGHGPRRQGGNG
jgi:hypothetical protein